MPKKIDVSFSSFVDLKSELFKKQQDFARKKTTNTDVIGRQLYVSNKKALFDNKKSSDKDSVVNGKITKMKALSDEDERKLRLSKERLIQKSALYEKLASGNEKNDKLDQDGNSLFLVDFGRKAQDENSESEPEKDDGPENSTAPEKRAEHSDDEWTDYVDSFGRTRRCMKKDLPVFLEADKKFSRLDQTILDGMDFQPSASGHSSGKSASGTAATSGPVHYQQVLQDEIRDHGAAYYQFSSDEAERKQQMKRLEELRQQTVEKRQMNERLKEKRKIQMQARLAKVKERKKLTADIEDEIDPKAAEINLADILLPGEEDQETKAKRLKDEQVELKRAQHVRPWDKKKPKFSQDEWMEHERQHRYSDFAPPSVYFSNS